MATQLDISGYTLNPKESGSIQDFIIQQFLEQPALTTLHKVWTGVKMKEQIAFVNRFGKTGIKDSTCTRPASGAKATTAEKFWEPKNIGDTFVNCQAEMDGLFKAYFDKITSYAQKFNIEGSDLDKLIIAMVEDSMMKAVYRYAWFGDTAVAAAGAATAGLKSAANVKFYDAVDGLWKQIFAGVTATTIKKVAITENAQLTLALQLTLASDRAKLTLDAMYKNASIELQTNPTAKFLLTGELWENYYQWLLSKGVVYDINLLQNGLQSLKYRGFDVINMNTIWDYDLQGDFVDNTTNNAGYLPNRAVFTYAENTPIATLNENDLASLESWYNQDERVNKTAYGFTLDAKVIKESEIVVAY